MSEGGFVEGLFGAAHGAEELGKGALGLFEGESGAWADVGAGADDMLQGGLQAAWSGVEFGGTKIPGLDAFTGLMSTVGGAEKMFDAENDEELAEGAGQSTFGLLHTGLGLAEDAVGGLMAADGAAMVGTAGAGAAATAGTGGLAAPVAVPATAAAEVAEAAGEGGLAAVEFGLTAADVAVSGTEMGLDLVGGLSGMGSANSIVGGIETGAVSGVEALWSHFAG